MKFSFTLLFGLFLTAVAVAQPRVICDQHYLSQLNRLKKGVLVVDLGASPVVKGGIVDVKSAAARESQLKIDESKALFEAFRDEYSFSSVIFRYPAESGGYVYINTLGETTELSKDSTLIFNVEQVSRDARIKGCQYEKLVGKDSWELQVEIEEQKKLSEFEKQMVAYDPENIDQGGLVISPQTAEITKLKKKKRASSKFTYKSRLNGLSPVNARYRESVSYFEKKLTKELKEFLKRGG